MSRFWARTMSCFWKNIFWHDPVSEQGHSWYWTQTMFLCKQESGIAFEWICIGNTTHQIQQENYKNTQFMCTYPHISCMCMIFLLYLMSCVSWTNTMPCAGMTALSFVSTRTMSASTAVRLPVSSPKHKYILICMYVTLSLYICVVPWGAAAPPDPPLCRPGGLQN